MHRVRIVIPLTNENVDFQHQVLPTAGDTFTHKGIDYTISEGRHYMDVTNADCRVQLACTITNAEGGEEEPREGE